MNQIHYLSGKLSGSLNEHGRNGQQVTLAFNLLTLQEVFLNQIFFFIVRDTGQKYNLDRLNCLYTETTKWSEDPDAFHQGLYCLLRLKQTSGQNCIII